MPIAPEHAFTGKSIKYWSFYPMQPFTITFEHFKRKHWNSIFSVKRFIRQQEHIWIHKTKYGSFSLMIKKRFWNNIGKCQSWFYSFWPKLDWHHLLNAVIRGIQLWRRIVASLAWDEIFSKEHSYFHTLVHFLSYIFNFWSSILVQMFHKYIVKTKLHEIIHAPSKRLLPHFIHHRIIFYSQSSLNLTRSRGKVYNL